MTTNISVSVIIPVFNAENYLVQCLTSVVNQTLKNIEIIIIDDCSVDNSYSIIKEFAAKDYRIEYYKNDINKGQGLTRNEAISMANGEYIYFLDSDDVIELDSLEKLFRKAINDDLDILQGRYYKIKNNIKIINPKNNFLIDSVLTGQEYINRSSNISIVVWDKLWKRSFLIENELRFKKRKYEDVDFTLKAFTKAKKVSTLDLVFYNYYIRENSTMTSPITRARLEDSLELVRDLEMLYVGTKGQLINPQIERFFFNGIVTILNQNILKCNNRELKIEFANKVLEIFKQYRYDVLRAKKMNILNKLLLFISPIMLSKFYGFYRAIRNK